MLDQWYASILPPATDIDPRKRAPVGTEAAFAALCGVAPVPASSGKTIRHRLSRGGDRAANAALSRIALLRMACDPRTRDYVARQTPAGRTKKEIRRSAGMGRPGGTAAPRALWAPGLTRARHIGTG
ncbi:transposase [Streptomyces sp. TN58]|uniref:transposase n=1 Tax=Streptomyces sp. TN58 TaxID=234612 RepID=UPI003B63A903